MIVFLFLIIPMTIKYEDLPNQLRLISISGRLDIQGTDEIATKFAALACVEHKRVVVDLTGVTFLASIGIRSLIINAKTLQNKGGRMVLFVGDNNSVINTLAATGIDSLLPTFTDLTSASQAALD